MSKFFDYGDSGTNTSDETNIGGEKRWFNIHGTDNRIGGIKLSFCYGERAKLRFVAYVSKRISLTSRK